MRILVADDSRTFRFLLQSRLTTAGHDVVVAENGLEALAILQGKEPPPLAILDWQMPGMDGPDICRAVRRTTAERYTYLILLTAKDAKEDAAEALNAGADDFLSKQFDRLELEARIRAGRRIVELEDALRTARATRD